MDLNKINSVLTSTMLLLLGIVCIGTLMALVVPQAVFTVAVALFLLGIVTAVNFILTFYLLVQYISSLIKQTNFNYEEQEDEDQRDSTEGSQEDNARDNPNAETNGNNGQKETKEQDGMQRFQFQTVQPLNITTIDESLILEELNKAKFKKAGRLTEGVTTTRKKF